MIQNKPKMMEKKERILKISLSLFTQKGFYNTSTAQIAKESGIASGTLFTYFATKEELIDQIYIECLNEVIHLNDETFKPTKSSYEQIYSLTRGYLDWSLQHIEKFFYINMYNNSSYRKIELVEQFYQYSYFIEAFENGRDEGVFKSIPTDFAVYFWTKSINGVIEYYISRNSKIKEDCVTMITKFMLECITNS